MRKLVPLHKQSKKQRKEYNAKQRGSWNGISPVTRIVPNGKAYDYPPTKHSIDLLDRKYCKTN